ncbi:MAG: hypothetical protein HQM08_22345 [Candidatus Riflebacteria bacterium]|nr:hypothetical protein [Candidatus Riflebacteria bacterium]
MDKVNTIAIVLGITNVLFWFLCQPEEIKENPFEIRAKIQTLENEMPELEKLASWTIRAELCVKDPPSQEPNTLLAKLRAIAQGNNFLITESVNQGGEPNKIIISGRGNYRAAAGLVSELDHNKATQIAKISMELRDDNLIETSIEAIVQNGAWYGQAPDKDKPEPIPEISTAFISLGKFDLFNAPKAVVSRPIPRSVVKYIGYYSEHGQITVILEENGKVVMLNNDESSPAGNKIVSATEEKIALVNQRGAKWVVAMEKLQ